LSEKTEAGVSPEEMLRSPLEQRLARIRDAFEAPAGNANRPLGPNAGPQPLPSALHPIAALKQLAAALEGTSVANSIDDLSATPGPEGLHDAAGRFGLTIEPATKALGAIESTDCPCLLLLKDGLAHVVSGIATSGDLEIRNNGVTIAVARGRLQTQVTGGLIRVRLQSMLAREQDAPTSVSHVQATAPRSFVALMRQAVLAEKKHFATLLVAGAISCLVALALPMFTMAVFDRVIPHMSFETLWALALGVCLLLTVDFFVRQSRSGIAHALGISASQGLTARLYNKLLHVPLARLPRHASQITQPFHELTQAPALAIHLSAALLVDLPFFAIVTLYLIAIAGPVGWLLPLFALFGAAAQILMHRAAVDRAKKDIQITQRQIQLLIDGISGVETIKAIGGGPRLLADWERMADEAAIASHHVSQIHAKSGHIAAFLNQVLTVAVMVIGVYEISQNGMTMGALSAAMLLAGRALTPVQGIVSSTLRLHLIAETTKGLRSIVETEPELGGDARNTRAIRGDIELKNVSFSHAGEERATLVDITFSIKAGERVALIGRAGCGKSSLLKLITRLYEPSKGTLLIDGRDERQFEPYALRRAIALMPQDSELIDQSLDFNLRLGQGDITEAHFEAVTRLTGVAQFASRLPKGFSSPVGPGGKRLSGGERQAVNLSRALLGKPRMLLLDEPSAAMDNEREAQIIAGLGTIIGDAGLLIATHRLPLLALVDRIIIMDQGRIVADGPRTEILQKIQTQHAA
jgi:ATP-binding cassette, subfamily C, bacterial LapB